MTTSRFLFRARRSGRFCCWIVLLALPVSAAAGSAENPVRMVADQSSPWLLLDDGRPLPTMSNLKRTAAAAPRALARADLDRNGIPDLLVGLDDSGSGRVVVYLGDQQNYPARGATLPFQPALPTVFVPLAPDLIAAGDFDADGCQDVVVAARDDHRLALLAGDNTGALATPVLIDLPGPVTAMATGEVNRRDSLADLVICVGRDENAQLMVFESPQGALRGTPEVHALQATCGSVAIGQLVPGAEREIVVAAGSEVVVVAGRDRKLTWTHQVRDQVPAATTHRFDLAAPVTGIAFGRFSSDNGNQLAVQTSDGKLTLVQSDGTSWQQKQLSTASDGRLLGAARISARPQHELVFDRGSSLQLQNLADNTVGASITKDAAVVAVLPLRLNLDALDDLVVLLQGHTTPQVLTTKSATTFTVNVTDDLYDGICNLAHCSLRDAIREANQSPGLDTIDFSVGYDPIVLSSTMLQINESVVVDGLQGVCPATCHSTEIDASGAGAGAVAILVVGGGTAINDMQIHGADNAAIKLDGSANTVEKCRLGFDRGGNAAANGIGLLLQSSADNTIGGSSSQANIFAGNSGPGIHITNGSASNNNTVTGNYVGTDLSGATDIPNGGVGILLNTLATDNTIGSTAAPNVISGNTGGGIQFGSDSAASLANLVVANLIGVDGDGVSPLPNGGIGILVNAGSSNNTIGGTTTGLGNIISKNLDHGIEIKAQANNTQIQGNIIGLASDGSTSASNSGAGIVLDSADDCLIGGTVAAAGNTIAKNTSWGIVITGSGGDAPTSNTVLRNRIGTDTAGTTCRGNSSGGIRLTGQSNSIGSDVHFHRDRNVIGCNGGPGISLSGNSSFTTSDNVIAGNSIGRVQSGYGELPNAGHGIAINGMVNDTIVGIETSPNIISHNDGAGIVVSGSGGALPEGNRLRFNEIEDNGGLGIDLAWSTDGDGVTPNDGGLDTDTGPNGLQNFPVITDVDKDNDTITVSLESTPNSTFIIDVWIAGTECDPSGHGEAQLDLGASFNLNTGSDGTGAATSGETFLDLTDLLIVAAATNPGDNTSELSECFWEGRGLITHYIFSDGFDSGSLGNWSQAIGDAIVP